MKHLRTFLAQIALAGSLTSSAFADTALTNIDGEPQGSTTTSNMVSAANSGSRYPFLRAGNSTKGQYEFFNLAPAGLSFKNENGEARNVIHIATRVSSDPQQDIFVEACRIEHLIQPCYGATPKLFVADRTTTQLAAASDLTAWPEGLKILSRTVFPEGRFEPLFPALLSMTTDLWFWRDNPAHLKLSNDPVTHKKTMIGWVQQTARDARLILNPTDFVGEDAVVAAALDDCENTQGAPKGATTSAAKAARLDFMNACLKDYFQPLRTYVVMAACCRQSTF